MFITSIDLDTLDLAQARAFYTQTLGLHLQQETADAFTVQAGATALTALSRSSMLANARCASISQTSGVPVTAIIPMTFTAARASA